MVSSGSLALVGSGEYLPSMQELEHQLLRDGIEQGKRPVFVQLATAAGQEGGESIEYWQELGRLQAERLNVEVDFLPVFNREDASTTAFDDRVENAALIYFSGGDPHHLANSLRDTPLWKSVEKNFKTGGSLAGCSAGAMFLSKTVPSLRFLKREPVEGVGLLPDIQVIPHYDRFGKFVPDAAVRLLTNIPSGITLTGVDEETALTLVAGEWSVWGRSAVHLLNGPNAGRYTHGQSVPL